MLEHSPARTRLDPHRAPARRRQILHETIRYRYPVAASSLTQQLIVVPPAVHGSQRTVDAALSRPPSAERTCRMDRHGNVVVTDTVAGPFDEVEWQLKVTVEHHDQAPRPLSRADAWLYLQPGPLTRPDTALTAAAYRLAASCAETASFAQAACALVHRQVPWTDGATTVTTTAAEAFRLGAGVCQDQAQIMVALCRAVGIPARYVSGHLAGEGASHAWVETLIDGPGGYQPVGWDPTHDRQPDDSYLVVAVGADYHDVAPLSGTCDTKRAGTLEVTRRLVNLD